VWLPGFWTNRPRTQGHPEEEITMWETLQHAEWVTTLATNTWLYAFITVVHYFSLFFCVGTIVLLDLRILGIADRNQALTPLAEQLRPWTWIGVGFTVVSGFLLFATEAGDYAAATPFRIKMLIIVMALIFALAVQWNVAKWDRAPAIPLAAKLLAVASIVFWLGAILVGVEIAPLTGLG
jgi:hypothetical protein